MHVTVTKKDVLNASLTMYQRTAKQNHLEDSESEKD